MTFNWAAINRLKCLTTPTTLLEVFINGNKIANLCPTDKSLAFAEFAFTVTGSQSIELKFCGAGGL